MSITPGGDRGLEKERAARCGGNTGAGFNIVQ